MLHSDALVSSVSGSLRRAPGLDFHLLFVESCWTHPTDHQRPGGHGRVGIVNSFVLQFLVVTVAGFIHRRQQDVIE